eukprot:jgi/Chlat1/5286/Chrsp35S05237
MAPGMEASVVTGSCLAAGYFAVEAALAEGSGFKAAVNKHDGLLAVVASSSEHAHYDVAEDSFRLTPAGAPPSPSELEPEHMKSGPFCNGVKVVSTMESWRVNMRGDDSSLGPTRPQSWWTGKTPAATPGFANGKLTSLPMPNLSTCTREQVLDYFDNSWTLTEVLFSALQGEEAFYRPPYHSLRHPLIFYYCHPAALYINKLRVAGVLADGVNSYFETIFETGVDEMSWDDLSKNEMLWPAVHEVTEYRRTVYGIVRNIILNHDSFSEMPITQASPAWAMFMGFEHERIHLETSSVLMRELPIRLLKRPAEWPAYHPSLEKGCVPVVNELLPVPAGQATLGKPYEFPSYGWDNEYGSRKFDVSAFEANRFLVTNAEYLTFVKSGGYSQPRHWTEDGWKWRTFRNAKWPCFWDALPVVVNCHEAKAYCNWRAEQDGLNTNVEFYRLATEAEHHRLRDAEVSSPEQDPVMVHSGAELSKVINVNLAYGAECPVNALPANKKGFHDVTGNLWQWCEDHIAALPGFRLHKYYDDFSTPCFDGEHNIIMGGSFVSTGDEASLFSRYHFRPHFFQHAGIRMVKAKGMPLVETSCMDAPAPHVGSGPCCTSQKRKSSHDSNSPENRLQLAQQLSLHYDSFGDLTCVPHELTRFQERITELLFKVADRHHIAYKAALDVGCSVGGLSFALASRCQRILGIELNHASIDAANTLHGSGRLQYTVPDEGELTAELDVAVSPSVERERVAFRRMDPCSMAPDLGSFDLVCAVNVLSRLPSPSSCLGRMAGPRGLVRVGGLLLVADTFAWSEQITPKELWLGGVSGTGEALRSKAGLQQALEQDFELLHECDMPALIRDASRKLQLQIPHVSIWHRHT